MIKAEMRVRYRADPDVIGWVTDVTGEIARVFVDGSVKTVPISELEPVPDLVAVDADEFRVALTKRRLEHPVTDQYLSYKASNTRLFYHQFLPVKKMLESPAQRLLIADEVGTGKTIEAGLIWAELESRSAHGLENVWVVCPKPLVRKWRDEMLQRFDFHLEELSPDGLRQALASLRRDGVLPPRFAKCVVNIELLRLRDYAQRLHDSPVEWDLAIFDEAHHVRNTDTLSHALARLVCSRSRAAVFLTATPLQTGLSDLVHLMEALGVDVAEDPRALEEQMRWDMRLNDWMHLLKRQPPGWERDTSRILEELDSTGRHRSGWRTLREMAGVQEPLDNTALALLIDTAHGLQVLNPYMTRTLRSEVQEQRPTREAATRVVRFTPAEKEFYDAVYSVCLMRAEQNNAPPGFVTQMPERRTASCVSAVAAEVLGSSSNSTASKKTRISGEVGIEDERDERQARFTPTEIRMLSPFAHAALDSRDYKLETLYELLLHVFSGLQADRVIVFSTFRGTLRYLERQLTERGYSVELMYGPTPVRDEDCRKGEKSRERIAAEFRRGEFQILLASEVAGEGLDFEHCNVIVNYDLPWNPMRVEQRIGRCDRLGQTADKVHILNITSEGTIEERILQRLYERLGLFERALGGMEAVLGEEIARFRRSLFVDKLSEQQQLDRLERAARAIESRERHRETVTRSSVISERGRHLIDSDQQGIRDTESGFLTPEDLAEFVHGTLQRHLPGTLCETATPERFRLIRTSALMEALHTLLTSYPASSNARAQINRLRERVKRKHSTPVVFNSEDTEAEFVHVRHPLLLLARHLNTSSEAEIPWCSAVVPADEIADQTVLIWAIATLHGYASRSEVICMRVDPSTWKASHLPLGQAQQLAKVMTTPPDDDQQRSVASHSTLQRPAADVQRAQTEAERTLWQHFNAVYESFAARDRVLVDKAKQAVRSHAERQQRRNSEQLDNPNLDIRLKKLYSGWNRRIAREVETKIRDIARRSDMRSSLEIIGIALLTPAVGPQSAKARLR